MCIRDRHIADIIVEQTDTLLIIADTVHAQSFLIVFQGFGSILLVLIQTGQVAIVARHSGRIPDLFVDLQGFQLVLEILQVVSLVPVDEPQITIDRGFSFEITRFFTDLETLIIEGYGLGIFTFEVMIGSNIVAGLAYPLLIIFSFCKIKLQIRQNIGCLLYTSRCV